VNATQRLSLAVRSLWSLVLLLLGAFVLVVTGGLIGALLVTWPIFWGLAFALALVAVTVGVE
jgi:hypothetical protein